MTRATVSRRDFLRGSAALGLVAVMPTAVLRAARIADHLSLTAPVAMPDRPGSGRVLGWAVVFEEPDVDTNEAAQLGLWRGDVLLERDIVQVRMGSFQTYYLPDQSPVGDLADFRLEMDVPGYAVLYTDRGVAVLRVAG